MDLFYKMDCCGRLKFLENYTRLIYLIWVICRVGGGMGGNHLNNRIILVYIMQLFKQPIAKLASTSIYYALNVPAVYNIVRTHQTAKESRQI